MAQVVCGDLHWSTREGGTTMPGYSISDLAVDVQRMVDQHADVRQRTRAIEPYLRRWMDAPDLTDGQRSPCEGRACGHLLHTAADGSFFIISVVFPPGTSSGVHYHGAWGVIGVLAGTDEETKYARAAGPAEPSAGEACELQQTAKLHFPPGSVTYLLPPDEGYHRVRAVGDEAGVSLHILGGTPETHPHLLCHPESRKLVDFPMAALLDQVPPAV
jgi:predicted metal-dependent enzyme (double-stranded beta helix superfamily)